MAVESGGDTLSSEVSPPEMPTTLLQQWLNTQFVENHTTLLVLQDICIPNRMTLSMQCGYDKDCMRVSTLSQNDRGVWKRT